MVLRCVINRDVKNIKFAQLCIANFLCRLFLSARYKFKSEAEGWKNSFGIKLQSVAWLRTKLASKFGRSWLNLFLHYCPTHIFFSAIGGIYFIVWDGLTQFKNTKKTYKSREGGRNVFQSQSLSGWLRTRLASFG